MVASKRGKSGFLVRQEVRDSNCILFIFAENRRVHEAQVNMMSFDKNNGRQIS